MKLVSLNIWGGKVYQPLIEFIKNNSEDTDIFCFQEVFSCPKDVVLKEGMKSNIFSDISNHLPGFNGYFASAVEKFDFGNWVDYDLSFGLAIFIKQALRVESTGDIFVHLSKAEGVVTRDNYYDMPKNLQYLIFSNNKKKFCVANIHGHWYPNTKEDTPERIEQSKNILRFLNSQNCAKILCGDFNLLPDATSLKMIEESGMKNWIKEYKIIKTRSSKLYLGSHLFADYTLVSQGIKVKGFKVPDLPISDHLPMILEFE